MANPTSHASGTQTVTATGVEYSLSDVTSSGTFQSLVDLAAMAAGDVVELRAKQTVLGGGTKRTAGIGIFYGAQPTEDLIAYSNYFPNLATATGSLEFTLKQTKGTTGRAYPYKVFKWT